MWSEPRRWVWHLLDDIAKCLICHVCLFSYAPILPIFSVCNIQCDRGINLVNSMQDGRHMEFYQNLFCPVTPLHQIYITILKWIYNHLLLHINISWIYPYTHKINWQLLFLYLPRSYTTSWRHYDVMVARFLITKLDTSLTSKLILL